MSLIAAKPPFCARSAVAACVALVAVLGCSRPPAKEERREGSPSSPSARDSGARDSASAPACPRFRHEVAGLVADGRLVEASGLVASRRHPGVLYSHNDSGDGPRILALGEDGRSLGAFALAGATAVDWEDLALAPCAGLNRDCLYAADIGGNARPRESVEVYEAPEPEVIGPTDNDAAIGSVVKISLRYPQGAHDSEALLIDPRTRQLYVITKNLAGRSRVYRAKLPSAPVADPLLMEAVATLAFGVPPLGNNPLVTGGAFSLDGRAFILKTYSTAFLWKLEPDESFERALGRAPCPLPTSSEPQGEAVSFAAREGGYYTLSEGVHPPLHRFVPE